MIRLEIVANSLCIALCFAATITSTLVKANNNDEPVEYGVDVSFPMQHSTVSTNYPWLNESQRTIDMVSQPLGDRQTIYQNFLDGCVNHFGKKGARCVQNENDRIAMTLRQPQSMQNYTSVGYKKIRAPPKLWNLIQTFWNKNKDKGKAENWGVGNTYTNNWESSTKMVSVEDSGLRGGGKILKDSIWNAARSTISEWTGQELTPCSLYGVRIYQEGSVLAPHVDRLPLVSSAIINVAQDVDEPWPLEVIGRDGKAKNVTMEPGDMVLYESHSTIHGRPFPLKGRYFANIFVHFEPTGHTLRHHNHETNAGEDVDQKYRDSMKQKLGGHENQQHDNGLPSYILTGSPESERWQQNHPSVGPIVTEGSTVAHKAAQNGDLGKLKIEVDAKKHLLSAKDEHGWQPIHEGARGGHIDVVRYLVENGADINAKTTVIGGTALYYAKQEFKNDHPVVAFLESLGAVDIGPDL